MNKTNMISVIDKNGHRMFLQFIDYFTGECAFTDNPMNAAKYINDDELLQADCALIYRDLGLTPEIFQVKHKFI